MSTDEFDDPINEITVVERPDVPLTRLMPQSTWDVPEPLLPVVPPYVSYEVLFDEEQEGGA